MEIVQFFISGVLESIAPKSLLYIAFGVVWGIIGGATPGISASIAMALILPLTYGMSPLFSLPMLAAVYVGAEYGGSIPAILINTPGTGAAAATTLDGYKLNEKGMGGKALLISLYAGGIGGLVSVLIMAASTIPLARFALRFGPTQYFWLAIMGLSVVGSVSGDNPLKGIISACIGLLLSCVGADGFTGHLRFTFGLDILYYGLELVPVMVGLFAMSSTTRGIVTGKMFKGETAKVKMTYPTTKELRSLTPLVVIMGALGCVIGALPGAGATIASWVGYSQAKIFCKNGQETFGTGDVRGVAAPESANNGVPAGALIPLLALGIPGSNSTAILMSGFAMAGITTGPMLFVNNPQIPYKLMASMFVAQIILLVLGLLLMKPFVLITGMNKVNLAVAIIALGVVGAYSTTNTMASVWMLLLASVLGYILNVAGFSAPAVVLGFVLGDLVELNFRRSIQLSRGDVSVFFEGGINIVLILITGACLLIPFIKPAVKRIRNKTRNENDNKTV